MYNLSLTPRQSDYLQLMADCKRWTVGCVSKRLKVRASTTIATLVRRGFLEKITTTLPYRYRITKQGVGALAEHRIVPYCSKTKPPISQVEKRYLAILINSGETGQVRNIQFQKLFPHRTQSSINNMPYNLRRSRLIR